MRTVIPDHASKGAELKGYAGSYSIASDIAILLGGPRSA